MARKNPPSGSAQPGPRRTTAHERARRTAQTQAALERRRRREVWRQVGVALGVLVVIAAIFTVLALRAGTGGTPTAVDPSSVPTIGSSSYGLGVGDKDAAHRVIIYEDFICPYCGQLEAASHAGLAADAAAGRVYVEYRPFNLLQTTFSAQALNAFAAVKTLAGSQAARTFHDLVYANQPEEPGPNDARDELVAWADQAVPATKRSAVEQAIRDETSQRAWTDGATAAATAAGVHSTPTVLLDGQLFEEGSTATEMGQRLVEAVR